MSGDARASVQVDDGRTRVTRYDMAPHDRIAWHRHEHAYLVVPLLDGEIAVVTGEGAVTQRVRAGETYSRDAGAEHELVNGEHPYAFIEIEIVQPRSS